MKEKYLLIVIIVLFFLPVTSAHGQIWVEAEQFQEKGGWIVDPQFIDQMGSAYLLAHGLGEPVQPARTILQIKKNRKLSSMGSHKRLGPLSYRSRKIYYFD